MTEGEWGVENHEFLRDVINGWPLMCIKIIIQVTRIGNRNLVVYRFVLCSCMAILPLKYKSNRLV